MLKQTIVNQDQPPTEWLVKRVGFTPDTLVRVVGVTMGEEGKQRQKMLEKAKAFQGPDTSPPCYLEREPDNPYDPNAIKVHIGYDMNKLPDGSNKWVFGHVGYLPKDLQVPARNKQGKVFEKSGITGQICRDSIPDLFPLTKMMDGISKGKLHGKVLCGIDFVTKAPKTSSWGIQVGIRHEV